MFSLCGGKSWEMLEKYEKSLLREFVSQGFVKRASAAKDKVSLHQVILGYLRKKTKRGS